MTAPDGDRQPRQRIDKWLWFARVVKTRSAAQKLAVSGHVRVNLEKNEAASRQVKPGDVLTIALERTVLVLRVLARGERRGPAPEARLLFEDISPTAPKAESNAPRDSGAGRPTKRDRRAIDRMNSVQD